MQQATRLRCRHGAADVAVGFAGALAARCAQVTCLLCRRTCNTSCSTSHRSHLRGRHLQGSELGKLCAQVCPYVDYQTAMHASMTRKAAVMQTFGHYSSQTPRPSLPHVRELSLTCALPCVIAGPTFASRGKRTVAVASAITHQVLLPPAPTPCSNSEGLAPSIWPHISWI